MSQDISQRHLFCFGLGYSAQRLSGRLKRSGWTVAGTCRSDETRRTLRSDGYEMHLFDRGMPVADIAEALGRATHVLSSVPPDSEGDPVLDHHAADIAAASAHLNWAGYLSTTGVYGDRGGGWVNEATPVAATSRRARRRVAAEAGWLDLQQSHAVPAHIFRLPGIYGPGRSAIDQVRAGTARRLVKPGQVFCRIHVDDIASVLEASMTRPRPGAIYNLCDDEPAANADVVAHAAALLGVAPPPEIPIESADLSEMARSFYSECRRVRNDLIKLELETVLQYPTYREGLEAILAETP